MKLIRSSIRSAVSVAVVASMMLQTGVGAFAADDNRKELGEQRVFLVESEPSQYGDIDVQFVTEDGTPVELSLIPDASGMDYLDSSIPAAYDLRDYGLVTSVKNQNPTGTCWAHASLAAAESALIKDGLADNTIDLSEAHMVWFSLGSTPTDPDDPLYGDGSAVYNLGTGAYNAGGHIYSSRSILSSWVGTDYEANYPNVATSPELDERYRYNSIFHLQNAYEFDKSDRDSIKSYLMSNGALTIAYYYSGTYENNTENNGTAYYNNVDTVTNHAVTLVGWDDNYSKSNFKETPEGDGAWLIKNSWDTWYGEDGYFWLSYYDTSIDRISSMEMEPVSNYSGIYQYASVYDGYVFNDSYGGGMGIIFTAEGNDPLSAVSFQTSQASTDYEIRIYSGAEYGTPLSGTLVHTQTGTATYAGLHTIKLNKLISIPAGTNFSVYIHMNKKGSSVVMDDYSTTTGRCFYGWGNSLESINWKDSGVYYQCDIHVKAYTSSAETPLTAPTITSATADGTTVSLAWNAVDGATSYRVYRADSETGTKTLLKTVGNTFTTDSTVTAGKTYYYFVAAYNSKTDTLSDYSAAQSVAVPATLAAPTITSATASGTTVNLAWNAVDGATSYRVYRADSATGTKTLLKTVSNPYTYDATVTAGKTYYYFVAAYSSKTATLSAYSAAKSVAVPATLAAPTITSATSDGKTVNLAWNAVDGATSYRVYRADSATGTKTLLKTVGNPYTYDATVTAGKTYYYFVAAYSSKTATLSAYSAAKAVTVTATLAAPTITSATADGTTVNLAWNAVDGATSYRVYRADSATGTKTLLKTVGNAYTYDATVTAGKTYYYFVAAYSSKTATLSAYSAAKSVTVAATLAAPTITTATTNGTTVNLAWNAVDGATSYRVYRADSATGTKTLLKTVGNAYTYDATVTAGKTYYYFIAAYSSKTGTPSAYSEAKAVTALATPVITSATASGTTVNLAWNAVTGATSYRIYRADSATGTKTLLKTVGNPYTFDATVISGKTYYYFVAAYNSTTAVLSAYSAAKSVTVS